MTKEQLLQENEILKEGYIKLLNDKDVLLTWGKPQLEALYATKIGALQLEQLKLQLAIKALKRKIELVYQYINRNEHPDFIYIELTIAQELALVEKKIMQQSAEITQAKILLTHLSSPERSAELRKIFRKVAKSLHPDINVNITDEQLEIWYKIKDAYNTGDLERLKALQLVFDAQINSTNNAEKMSEEEIVLQNNSLKQGIVLLEEEIANIKKEFPFNLQDKINDEEWITEQQTTLKTEMAKLNDYESELKNELQQLINLYE